MAANWEPWSLETRRIFAERDPDGKVEGAGGFTNQSLYEAMKNAGVDYSFQLFGQDSPRSSGGGSLFQQIGDFVTSPAFLTLAGGVAGVAAGGAGAAAGAGSGTEAASLYGAGGEFAGAGAGAGAGTAGLTLAEQAAAIGSGSAAGTAAGTGVGTGVTAGTAATGTAGTAATGTALSRILDGTATTQDYLALTGQVAPSLLSAYGSDQQADAYKDLASKYMAMGAPYRDELSRISADPNAFYTSPTATKATESVLQRLSSKYGNPAGNPYAQALTVDALYDQYGAERDRLAGYGGLTQYASAAPGAASQAIGAQGTVYGDLGYGVGSVLNPPPKQMTLAELLRNARV